MSLEEAIEEAEEERGKDIAAKRLLEATLDGERAAREKAELELVVAAANQKMLERRLEDSWDTPTVLSLIGGSLAIGLLLGVFVVD